MKLSEAIRLGSKGTAQIYGRFYDEIGNSCALGAALKSYGLKVSDVSEWSMRPMFKRMTTCPEGCGVKLDLYSQIVHLNDDHRITREAISEWLEKEGI